MSGGRHPGECRGPCSVRRNGQPIVDALTAAGVPFIVVGMNNLFGTAEAEAARQLFYYLGGRENDERGVRQRGLVDAGTLRTAWQAAGLGLAEADLEAAIAAAEELRRAIAETTQRAARFSMQRVFQDFLSQAGVREEQVPDGRGEVVFYNLGKFSQIISDFETIHFHTKPPDKYESFANFLYYRAEDRYPEGAQRRRATSTPAPTRSRS